VDLLVPPALPHARDGRPIGAAVVVCAMLIMATFGAAVVALPTLDGFLALFTRPS
jgi:hypothetical protein